MFTKSKPISAISVLIDRLVKEEYEIDDLSDLPNLIEAIRLQSTGPTEAARAIRKKLKYGNPHRQLRALTILDDLIQNAGSRFQKDFTDEMLLERLRIIGSDQLTDAEVRRKCQSLFRQWAVSYKNTPGMIRIASLYQQMPQRKNLSSKEHSKVLKETEADDVDDESDPFSPHAGGSKATPMTHRRGSSVTTTKPSKSSPSSYSSQSTPAFTKTKADKKSKNTTLKSFNLAKEKPQINQVIASATVESTNLMNALKHINREKERVSENPDAKRRFETCKQLRRQTYRYCVLIEDESFLGTLLNANDSLSDALVLYEQLDRSFDYDSDSEDYEESSESTHVAKPKVPPPQELHKQVAGLTLGGPKSPSKPPRPTFIPLPSANGKDKFREAEEEEEADEDENDDDDPFADRNAVNTPMMEKDGMTWRDV